MGYQQLILLAAMFAFMYFIVIRPQKKRQKELESMRSNLRPGNKVVTIGGIVGEVVSVGEEVKIVTAGATEMVFVRTAIASVESGAATPVEHESASVDDGIVEGETEIKE